MSFRDPLRFDISDPVEEKVIMSSLLINASVCIYITIYGFQYQILNINQSKTMKAERTLTQVHTTGLLS